MSDSSIGQGPEALPRSQQILIGASSGVVVFAVCLTGFLIVRSLFGTSDKDVAIAKASVARSQKPPQDFQKPDPGTNQTPPESTPTKTLPAVPSKDAPLPIPGLPKTERRPIPGLPAIETREPGPAPEYDEDEITESSFLPGKIVAFDESILNPTEADFRRRKAMELEDSIESYEYRLGKIVAAIEEGKGTAAELAELRTEAAEARNKIARMSAERAKLGSIADDPLADVVKSMETPGISSPTHPSPSRRPPFRHAPPSSPSRKRPPMPSKESRRAANNELEEIFDFSKSRNDEEELKLAKELYGLGTKAPEGSGERYVLLKKAADLASAAGDASLMVSVADRMAKDFEMDALTAKGMLLAKFAKDANTSKKVRALLPAAERYVSQAIGAGKPKFAEALAKLTYEASQSSPDKDLRKAASDFRRKVQKDCSDLVKVENARIALQADSADPDANLALGQFYCLSQGNWSKGLDHLSKGSNVTLAQAAAKELAGASSASGYVEIGDVWWDAAASRQNEEKEEVLRHAAWWYGKALPELSGLEKAKVKKRLEEVPGRTKGPKVTETATPKTHTTDGFHPNRPNILSFPGQRARFVRITIEASVREQPCIDELEVYGTGKTNLAVASKGAKATASSCLLGYAIHKIPHLNDGKYGNSHSWIAAGQSNEWVQIELPRPVVISKVVFSRDRLGKRTDRMPRIVVVSLSDDGVKWRDVCRVQARAR